jgi:hypothetical protein
MRPAWITRHPDGPLVDGLLAVAWADGAIAAEERALLSELLEILFVDVSPEALASWWATPPDPDEVADRVTDPVARIFLLDRALLLAWADGAAAAGEEDLIQRWAARWGMEPEEIAALRDDLAARVSDQHPTG